MVWLAMHKSAVGLLIIWLLLVPLAAAAQDDGLRDLTSLEPLQRIIDGYASGDDISETVQINDEAGPLVSSLQFVVNLGWGPAFIDPDLPVSPTGLGESGLDLVSLQDFFDGPFNQIPPLDPWGTNQGASDISTLFPDWTAFGESGPIDGPVEIVEPPTLVWAIELAEPFDETCSEPRAIGRSWMGDGITSADAPLTADALSQAFGDESRAALANGENTRLVELSCLRGGDPIVTAVRMNADLGQLRPFGPTEIVALVKENHVVFFTTLRTLGLDPVDIPSFLYANDPGGAVAPFEPEADFPAIVPNVYDQFPDHIEITMDVPEEEEAASEPAIQSLVYNGSEPRLVATGTGGCPPATTDFFVDWITLGAGEAGLMWGLGTSIPTEGRVVPLPDKSWGGVEFRIEYPNGSVETITVDPVEGRVTTETAECEGTGTFTVNGEPVGSPSAPADKGPIDDSGGDEAEASGEPASPDDSGVPWWLIGLAAVLVAGLAYGVTRARTRTKDCQPEIEAWEAAIAAHDEAKRTRDHWQGERDHWFGLMSDTESRAREGSGEPDAELTQMAVEYREKFETARDNLDESHDALNNTADLVWQAQIALQNCQGSAPPLPDDGSPPSEPGSTLPPPPPPPQGAKGCSPNGTTKVEPEKGLPSAEFVVPNGNVILRGHRMASWNKAMGGGGGLAPNAVAALTDAQIEAALADFDSQTDRTVVDPQIPTRTVLASCGRVWKCQGGQWVKTNQTARLPDKVLSQDVEEITTGAKSPSKDQIKENVKAAKSRVSELVSNQADLTGFGCK